MADIIKFEYLCTLGFAAIVIFLGRAIVARSAPLRKYAIPAPVVSGIIFSILVSLIKGMGIVDISFDASLMKDLTQNIFFLCVGFGFSAKMLRHAGGKLCVMIAFAASPHHMPGSPGLRLEPASGNASASGSPVLFCRYVRRRRHSGRLRPHF